VPRLRQATSRRGLVFHAVTSSQTHGDRHWGLSLALRELAIFAAVPFVLLTFSAVGCGEGLECFAAPLAVVGWLIVVGCLFLATRHLVRSKLSATFIMVLYFVLGLGIIVARHGSPASLVGTSAVGIAVALLTASTNLSRVSSAGRALAATSVVLAVAGPLVTVVNYGPALLGVRVGFTLRDSRATVLTAQCPTVSPKGPNDAQFVVDGTLYGLPGEWGGEPTQVFITMMYQKPPDPSSLTADIHLTPNSSPLHQDREWGGSGRLRNTHSGSGTTMTVGIGNSSGSEHASLALSWPWRC